MTAMAMAMAMALTARGTDDPVTAKRRVGSRVRLYWDGDHTWYEGTVLSYSDTTGKHEVQVRRTSRHTQ